MTDNVLRNNKNFLLSICYKENNEPKSLILKPFGTVEHVAEIVCTSQHCKDLIKAGAISITAKPE